MGRRAGGRAEGLAGVPGRPPRPRPRPAPPTFAGDLVLQGPDGKSFVYPFSPPTVAPTRAPTRAPTPAPTINRIQCGVLMDLYDATGGKSWRSNTNWGTGDCCTNNWYGVTCTSGSVTRL